MTISSISTNTAALSATQNIGTATAAVQDEVTALSSGNRLVNASTDVAALSTGTALQSQVSSLTTALSIASQGQSLLQVADGALAQIQSIIEQQQSIAASAQSGSLSDTQRGFLQQEFQALSTQINQLASSTNFNGVDLLNGNIQGGTSVSTTTSNGNANTSTAVTIGTIAKVATAGDTFTISVGNGPTTTLTYGTSAGDVATVGTAGDTTASEIDAQAANVAAALNSSGNASLANYIFSASGANIKATYIGTATSPADVPTITTSSTSSISASVTGTGTTTSGVNTLGTLVGTIGTAATAGDIITVNGVAFTSVASGATSGEFNIGASPTAATTAAGIVAALNDSTSTALAGITFAQGTGGNTADIYAYYNGAADPAVTVTVTQGGSGTIVASSLADNTTLKTVGSTGLAAGTTQAFGSATGNLFVSGGTDVSSATNYGGAINLSGVYDNASFTGAFGGAGNIGAIQATYDAGTSTSTSGVSLSMVVGDVTYTAAEVTNSTLSGTGPNTITFTGNNTDTGASEGGSFTLTIQGSQSNITDQTQASQLADSLNAGLSSVSAYQNRAVTSYNNAFTAEVGGSQTATLDGSSLSFSSNDFSTQPIISSLSVSAPSTGSTDAKITAVVNGQTYTTLSGIGDTFKTNSQIVLENTSNPSEQLILTTGSTAATGDASGIAIDLSSASNAAAFQTALSSALGLSNTSASLSFQVGTSTADSIGVSIGSATTNALFGGQTLDVSTLSDAANASNVLTTALNTVTALRANVGALEESFNYATSAATSAQENEQSAASNLLDTDVASESTDFATSQVQLQAGIAVLAQANLLPQNLLKLLNG